MVEVVTVVGLACNSEPGRGSSDAGGAAVMVAMERCWWGFWSGMLVVMMEVIEVMVMEKRSGGGDGADGNSGRVVV